MREFFGVDEQKELDEAREDENYVPHELTLAEEQAIERKRQALERLYDLEAELIATYKIEINFSKRRSNRSHFPGSLMIWRSGSALSGGGDEGMYPCPDDRCPGYISPELISVTAQKAGCPKCQKIWGLHQLKEMRLCSLTPRNWALLVLRHFVRLGHDADVYLKMHPVDIRNQTLREQMKDCGGEQLAKARGNRQPVIYPLKNIIKDLSAGADMLKRFEAFVKA